MRGQKPMSSSNIDYKFKFKLSHEKYGRWNMFCARVKLRNPGVVVQDVDHAFHHRKVLGKADKMLSVSCCSKQLN